MVEFIKFSEGAARRSKSTRQSTGSFLLLVTLLILQLQIQLSLGQTEPTSTTSPLVSSPESSTADSTPTEASLSSVTPTTTTTTATQNGQNSSSEPAEGAISEAAVLSESLPDGGDKDDGNVGAALALAEAKRTTVKKELAPATEPTSSAQEETTTSAPSDAGRPLEDLLPKVNNQQQQQQQASELGSISPGLSSAISGLAEQLPNVYNRDQQNFSDPAKVAAEEAALQRLLPSRTNLFDKEAIEATQMSEMDCHLRNIDLCLAGLLGTSTKVLPETDAELETRCDEMKVTMGCMAMYNKRCGTVKVFSILTPFAQQSSNLLTPNSNLLTDRQKELLASSAAGISERANLMAAANGAGTQQKQFNPSLQSLMELCEPSARNQAENRQIRQRLFQLGKCINARIPRLTPCLEDLKTALQIFYEPRRVLPMRPTCCALARLRNCSMEALDRVCGMSSFEQLMGQFSDALGASNGPVGMIKTIDRVCRQATDHRSAYCREVLPPSGMKLPPRRSSKSSKLVKALDLISFAPATQEMGAF